MYLKTKCLWKFQLLLFLSFLSIIEFFIQNLSTENRTALKTVFFFKWPLWSFTI